MPLPLLVVLAAVLALVQVQVGPGRCAAVGGVAELVDVEAVQAGLQVAHVTAYLNGARSLQRLSLEMRLR